MINSISFLSILICLSEKFFNIIANINSSSGLSILAKRQFFDLDLKSFKLNLISLIGIIELTNKYLLSLSTKLNNEYNNFSSVVFLKLSIIIFSFDGGTKKTYDKMRPGRFTENTFEKNLVEEVKKSLQSLMKKDSEAINSLKNHLI